MAIGPIAVGSGVSVTLSSGEPMTRAAMSNAGPSNSRPRRILPVTDRRRGGVVRWFRSDSWRDDWVGGRGRRRNRRSVECPGRCPAAPALRERCPEVERRLEPLLRCSIEIAHDGFAERGRQADPKLTKVGRLLMEAGKGRGGRGVAPERNRSGCSLVEHRAQGVQVGALVDATAADLLGREVRGGADQRAGDGEVRVLLGFRDAEVGEADRTVGGDQDVRRLDVAVHETVAMGAVEGTGEITADLTHASFVHRAQLVELAAERRTLDQLHHDGLVVARACISGTNGVVDGDDVRVHEARRG